MVELFQWALTTEDCIMEVLAMQAYKEESNISNITIILTMETLSIIRTLITMSMEKDLITVERLTMSIKQSNATFL